MATESKATKPKKLTVSEQRSNTVQDVVSGLESAQSVISSGPLEDLKSELEEMLENLEEKFSGTERYAAIEAARDALDNAISEIDSAESEIGSAIDELNNIDFSW